MTIQEQDTLIAELIELAIELGANKYYINKLIVSNGMSLDEAVYRGYIKEEKEND
jgi:hypothetical protein